MTVMDRSMLPKRPKKARPNRQALYLELSDTLWEEIFGLAEQIPTEALADARVSAVNAVVRQLLREAIDARKVKP